LNGVDVWKWAKPSTKSCFPRRTPNAICCPSACRYDFPNKSELEAQYRNSFSSSRASPTFSYSTTITMAPIPARTAAQFPFTEELEIAISIGIHSLPLFRASIPRVHGCQRLPNRRRNSRINIPSPAREQHWQACLDRQVGWF